MTYVPVVGFAPDLEPTTPGIIKDCNNVVPTPRGLKAAPTPVNTEYPTATATVIAGTSLTTLAGDTRTYIATSTEIFQVAGGSLTDRSTSAGYSAVVTWSFAQFGDATLASPDTSPIQRSTGTAFDPISGAPNAKVIEVVGRQVMALNTNDGVFGDSPDRWRCSALDDETDWTVSIATLAASGRLVDTPGPITAGAKLGDTMIAYKEKSMYLGRFVGSPVVWDWDLISPEIGTAALHGVANEGTFHAFVGHDDFFIYDGTSSPRPIGGELREWFFESELKTQNQDNIRAIIDRGEAVIYWFYPSNEGSVSGELDRWVAYRYRGTPRWGRGTLSVNTVFEYLASSAPTYDTLGDAYATYNDLPAISYDDSFWTAIDERIGIVGSDKRLKTFNGANATSYLTWFDLGQDGRMTFVSRVRPRFKDSPTTGTLHRAVRDNLGDMPSSSGVTYTLTNGKFDLEHEDRWFQFRTAFTGDMEILGLDIEAQEGSGE